MRLVLTILLAAASVLLALLWAWVAAASLLTFGDIGGHIGAALSEPS